MSLELDFIIEGKNLSDLKDYARRNKICGFSKLNKAQLIDLVKSDKSVKANSILTGLQRIILDKIIDLYDNGRDYEYILGVNGDFLAVKLNKLEKLINAELRKIEALGYVEGKPETYWSTPVDLNTGKMGKRQTIHTHNWRITEKGKKFIAALFSITKVR